MDKQNYFFQNFPDNNNCSFIFFAGFHLTVPLIIIGKQKFGNWKSTRNKLISELRLHNDYHVIDAELNSEFSNPFGESVLIKYKNFLKVFPINRYLLESNVTINNNDFSIDDNVWINPSGVVLISMNISWRPNCTCDLSLDLFREILGKHYVELSYIFIEVANTVFSALNIRLPKRDQDYDHECFFINKALAFQTNNLSCNDPLRTIEEISSTIELKHCYDNILIDIYFVEHRNSMIEQIIRIDYRDSTVINKYDPDSIYAICAIYASLINMFWLRKMLNSWASDVQSNGSHFKNSKQRTTRDLRLLQIYALQFINQSTPTSVCLIRSYMLIMEDCWREFRMNQLVENITDQLSTLETIISAVESSMEEIKNYRIGLAALFLSVISILAVTSELINTIDFNSELDVMSRIWFLILGFAIGVFLVSVIYFFPLIRKKSM